MSKLKHYWENLVIIAEFVKEHPKKMLVLGVILITLIIGMWHRSNDLLTCYKTAWYEQGVPTENFKFRFLTGTCVVKRSDGRWIPVVKAVDISEGEDLDQ